MADEKGNMDDLIREGFDNFGGDWDGSGFDQVMSGLNKSNPVDQAINTAFSSQDVQMTDLGWDEVHDKLDIETVWKRTNAYLDTRVGHSYFSYLQMIAIVMLFMAPLFISDQEFTVIQGSQNEVGQEVILVDNQDENNLVVNDEDPEELNIDQADNENENDTQEYQEIDLNNQHQSSTLLSITSNSNVIENTISDHTYATTESDLGLLAMVDVSNLSNDWTIPVWMQPEFILEKPEPQKKSTFRVGALGSVENTWLFSDITREGFDKSSFVLNRASVSFNYGITAQMVTQKGFMMKTNIFASSSIIQSNDIYVHGNQVTTKSSAEYFKYSLLFGYQLNMGKNQRHGLSFAAGPYHGVLRNAITTQDDIIVETESVYNRHDIGLQLDIMHTIKFGSFDFGYGIISNYGFNDANTSLDGLNRNFSVGLTGSVGYNF